MTRNKLDYLATLARVSYFLESGRPFSTEQIAEATGENARTVGRYLGYLRELGFRTDYDATTKRLKGAGKQTIEKAVAKLLKDCRLSDGRQGEGK